MSKNIHTIDVKDQSLGRVATRVAGLLRGKNKADFTPNIDNGDEVIIKNLTQLRWTGHKLEQKVYHHHSGYVGNLRTIKLKDLWQKNPRQVFIKAVNNMLPKNKLRPAMLKRLRFE